MTHDPTRDCEHGRLKGKCDVCDLQAEVDMLKGALKEWSDKTEWVQETAQPLELGMHRADVLKQRIERLKASIALDKKADNARELGLSYDDEPKIGCVNHDCDKCKAGQETVCHACESIEWEGQPCPICQAPAPQPVPVKTHHDFEPLPVAPVPNGPYSAPIKELWPVAPKPWVGLTDEEKASLANSVDYEEYYLLVENVEAKLKELNT
jgi:hypothetical protein